MLPGNLGGRGVALIALAAIVLWGFSGFFRVEPDELGVVLRFGKFVREVQPGLNYHLPYPIETALTPPALRVNKTDVGIRAVEGDAYFPAIDGRIWHEIARDEQKAAAGDDAAFAYVTYKRAS